MPATKEIIVPMGRYTVQKKSDLAPGSKIISPGAQTCIVVVLKSPNGIAVGHFDSPHHTTVPLQKMITELKGMGGKITANLYGGLYGVPAPFNTHSVSTPLYAELKRQEISYAHKDYNFTSVGATALAAVLCLSPLGPSSWLLALASVVSIYKSTDLLKKLPQQWVPGFAGSNIDVCVDVDTGNISTVKDDLQNTTHLLRELDREDLNTFKERNELNPKPLNPKDVAALAMLRIG